MISLEKNTLEFVKSLTCSLWAGGLPSKAGDKLERSAEFYFKATILPL